MEEVVTATSERYSCKTFKTSKMNDIIILTSTDQCWLRKSTHTGKALLSLGNGLRKNCMIRIGTGINRRDYGIEEKL